MSTIILTWHVKGKKEGARLLAEIRDEKVVNLKKIL